MGYIRTNVDDAIQEGVFTQGVQTSQVHYSDVGETKGEGGEGEETGLCKLEAVDRGEEDKRTFKGGY